MAMALMEHDLRGLLANAAVRFTMPHVLCLARQMLLAKLRKTLRPPEAPPIRRGDAVVFDYRVLHRGRGVALVAAVHLG